MSSASVGSAAALRTLQVGEAEYFKEAFDLRHAKKREVLETLVKRVPMRTNGSAPVSCFISYAWPEKGHANYEEQKYHAHWVERLADLLKLAGLHVFFDKWEDKVGKRIPKFMRELASPSVFVLVIGTKFYSEKCGRVAHDVNSEEHVVAAEYRIIEQKLLSSELRGERIFPILLEGKKEESFPELLREFGKIPCDFVSGDYFEGVLKLVLDLCGINGSTPEAQALIQALHVLSSFIEKEATDEKREQYRNLTIEEKLKLQSELKKLVNMDSLTPHHSPRHGAMAAMLERVTAQFSRPGFSPGSGLLPAAQDTGMSSASAASPPSSAAPLSEFSCLGPWRESVLKSEEVTGELELYVPLRAGSSPNDKNSSDLMAQVKTFLEDQEAQVLLLLGGSGSGKSSFGQYLEQELWQRHELAKGRIPLWINLPGLSNPQHKAIEEALEQKRVPFAEVGRLKQEKTFLFILDGYDEIRAGGNLYVSNRLGEWKAKVLLTCRQEYFMTDPTGYRYQFMPTKGQKPVPAGLWERYVSPFSKDDVNHYLQEYIKIKKSEWPLSRYLEQIENLPELRELIETPFLLRITAEVLPKVVKCHEQDKEALKLTRLALYEAFVTEWFGRNLAKYMQDSSIEVLGANPMEALWSFSERLAIKMHEAGVDAVQYEKGKSSPWTEFFKDEPEVNLMRRACPLKKAGASHYAFIHRSLLEYFLTPSLLKGIHSVQGSGKDEVPAAAPPFSTDLEILNRKLLDSEPSVIHFLVDAVRANPSLKDKLFAILEASKRDEKVATAAANAATILNAARASFVGRDLSHAKLPGADLSHGIYDSTNFEGADLSGVSLEGAWLHRANLRNTRMQGAQFGECPSLSFGNEIESCCYSPDGKWLAVACGKVIEIFDAATQEHRLFLHGHTNRVLSMAFSLDGRRLVSGGWDKTVRIWDVENGKALLEPLDGHVDSVTSVAFSPDGRHVAFGGNSKMVGLLDIEGREAFPRLLGGHMDTVKSVAFSPSGKRLVSASSDKTLRLWDVERGELLKTLEGHTDQVTSVAFSPDGKRLVSGSYDDTLRLWDIERGEVFLKPLTGHISGVTSVTFSPTNGKKVASGSSDGTVRLWDVECMEALRTLEGHEEYVTDVSFSPDGKRLVSAGGDKMLKIWNIECKEMLLKPLLQSSAGHVSSVSSVAFSPDGKTVVSGSDDKSVRLWDVECGENLRTWIGHTDRVRSVAFSADGRRVVSGSDDKMLRLWNVEQGEPLLKPFEGHTSWVTSVAFSPDGRKVVSGSHDKTLRLWDAEGGKVLRTLECTHPANGVVFSPDGRKIAFVSLFGWTVRLWDIEDSGAPLRQLQKHDAGVATSVAFSADGKWLVSGGFDHKLRLWDVEHGGVLKTLVGHTLPVMSVAMGPNGEFVASGGWAGVLIVHDRGTGSICCSMRTRGAIYSVDWYSTASPYAASMSDGATFLVTGHFDTAVRYWRWEKRQLTLLWSSHQGALAADGADIGGAQLSQGNAELLKRQGAVDGVPEARNECESKDEAKSAREAMSVPITINGNPLNQSSVQSSTSALVTAVASVAQRALTDTSRGELGFFAMPPRVSASQASASLTAESSPGPLSTSAMNPAPMPSPAVMSVTLSPSQDTSPNFRNDQELFSPSAVSSASVGDLHSGQRGTMLEGGVGVGMEDRNSPVARRSTIAEFPLAGSGPGIGNLQTIVPAGNQLSGVGNARVAAAHSGQQASANAQGGSVTISQQNMHCCKIL